jgi:RNA polymerase sigma-70 factor (ECF subfamily)
MEDDFDLLEAWRAGDAGAGNRLFHRHFDRVAWFFQNKVSDGLEDLIQETFLACVESRDKFRRESSFRSFLLGVAHNILRSHYRRKARRDGVIDFGVTGVQDLDPSPSAVIARRAETRLLARALRVIPLDAQVLLELYYWERLRGSELAEVLGVPEGTVRTRLRRARQLVQQAVHELAGSEDATWTTLRRIEEWAREIRAGQLSVPRRAAVAGGE